MWNTFCFRKIVSPSPPQLSNRNLHVSLETQEELPLNLAYEDSAVDSGQKAVFLFKRLEGSILLFNDYRHASPPARSKKGVLIDVQVDFTGLSIIRLHRSSQDRVRQLTP